MRDVKLMSDDEIKTEISQVSKRWDDFRKSDDEEGMAGSPGEWMVERLDELETEKKRRSRT